MANGTEQTQKYLCNDITISRGDCALPHRPMKANKSANHVIKAIRNESSIA